MVVLRDVEELSYQEIGEITGLPEGTDKIPSAPRPHGHQGIPGQEDAVASETTRSMDHGQAQDNFSDYVDGDAGREDARRGGSAPGALHPVPHRARVVSSDGRLARQAEATGAGELSPRHPAADLQALAGPLLRSALEAVRADPVRVGLARDDHRDARLLPGDAYTLARRREARALSKSERSGHDAEEDLQVLPLGERRGGRGGRGRRRGARTPAPRGRPAWRRRRRCARRSRRRRSASRSR